MTEFEKRLNEINQDLLEIESLLNVAKRQRIKNFLSIQLRRLISEKHQLEESFRNEKTNESKENKDLRSDIRNLQVKIDNYAWDQSPKFVKFFITIPKVQLLDPENIKCQFGLESMSLTVKNLENKDYVFNVNKLLHAIIPEKSYWRVKSDTIVVFLVKADALKWSFLTKSDEDKAQRSKYGDKSDKHDENSLFSLMKDMYEKGDDRLKRTIAQAWTEGASGKEYL